MVIQLISINDMKDFMSDLKHGKGSGIAALQFAILTAAQIDDVRGNLWTETYFKSGI